ncbi:HD domain-containing protein 2-like [Pecten maximus]|uniref:HD domain-containing protein 2-like n=1 Tax=Pecten maximus TaxID=6579 RepID=UPI00145820E0|nr:HD domain-containing protein 2-like [Pecten maximus]
MSSNLGKLFEYMSFVGQLKRVKRTGWVLKNVTDPESVSDHMYRMAMLSFVVDPKTGINKDRCIKMSLVHDMAESIVGDITPADNVSKEEKFIREEKAMEHITSLVSEDVSQEIISLWKEYESQSTKEARFVKDLDKFEMILQAMEYEQQDKRPKALQEFFDSTHGKFQSPQVKEWVEELKNIREENHRNDKT